jgi:hypothetical protein
MPLRAISGEISSQLSGGDGEKSRGEKSRGVGGVLTSCKLLTSLAMLLRSLKELLACRLLVSLSVFNASISAIVPMLSEPISLLGVQLLVGEVGIGIAGVSWLGFPSTEVLERAEELVASVAGCC